MQLDLLNKPSGRTVHLMPSGFTLDLTAPDATGLPIEDIAQCLASQPRWGGACRPWYSVAEHSVMASFLVPPPLAFDALMHDSEEFGGDWPSCWKVLLGRDYVREKLLPIKEALARWFGFRLDVPAVKQADLSGTAVLAFATHGLLSGELPGLAEPALVLTPPDIGTPDDDGLLTASEVAELRLSADWVLLSACNTAGSDGKPGAEGLSGLARAFLYAGARSILVSHWPVRDDAAARLTTDAIAAVGRGIGRSEALRRAMLALMEDKRDLSLAHPSAWAPFVVVGEGS